MNYIGFGNEQKILLYLLVIITYLLFIYFYRLEFQLKD